MNTKILFESFSSNYNEAALDAVEKMANRPSIWKSESTLNLFTMKEDVEKFHEFMGGFVEYKLDTTIPADKVTPLETIQENCQKFVNSLHQPTEQKYNEIPEFIKGYLEAIELHESRVCAYQEQLQETCTDAGVMLAVESMCNGHINSLTEKFNERMDWMVKASGYHTQQHLFRNREKTTQPVFM